MPFHISPSPRLRRSPFHEAVVAEGVASFAPYNHMLMPTGYGDPVSEYRRLTEGVAMWDVAVERQVEMQGPDAARLAQVLVPRKLAKMKPGMGWYVALCDHRGVIMNDPILLKLAEDHFWLSIADSDMLYWVRAIAAERGFDVEVREPDVSPLAIQGPKADDVVAALFGEDARTIRHFRFIETDLQGIPLVLMRSGWSKQGGFELYLRDGSRGVDLWNLVKEAGRQFGIGPGCPNSWERVESGLLSWGGDTDDATNPFEVRMERYLDLDAPDDVIGIVALRRIHAAGVRRHQLGVIFDIDEPFGPVDRRTRIIHHNADVGMVTAHAWSPRLKRNIGLALAAVSLRPGDEVRLIMADGRNTAGSMHDLPFL